MSEQKKKPARAPAKAKKSVAGEKATKAAAALKTSEATAKKPPRTKAVAKSAIAAGIPDAVTGMHAPPTHAEIATRAYGYYLERHGQHGHHLQDWLRAERELS